MADDNWRLSAAFWSKVDVTGGPTRNGCWLWRGGKQHSGYGMVRGREFPERLAHRMAYTLAFGPIPAGMWVLHHCDTPSCCNPRHLYLGDHARNTRDMVDRRRSRGGKPSALTASEREAIRVLGSRLSQRDIAARYGVGKATVARLVRGATRYPKYAASGTRNGRARLTPAIARAIRERYAAGGVTQSELGAEFGVNQTAISDVVRGVTWRDDAQG